MHHAVKRAEQIRKDEEVRNLLGSDSDDVLPLRYSAHVGIAFENRHPANLHTVRESEAGYAFGNPRSGAVVQVVVENGALAQRVDEHCLSSDGDAPPSSPSGGDARKELNLLRPVSELVLPGDMLVEIDGCDVDKATPMFRILELLSGESHVHNLRSSLTVFL
jgi:hypothetical protein